MAYLGPVHRWDIFWADLDEVVGREQAGSRRPVLVVSNDALNRSPLQLVAEIPLTSLEGKTRKFYPSEIRLPTGTIDPGVTPVAITHQVRTISKLRLLAPAGRLENLEIREQIEGAILGHFGIEVD
ncbi:MAG: type II toxin-antitoxin system PemK/MazF family toxin [Longimicrobiaceae bacterium]